MRIIGLLLIVSFNVCSQQVRSDVNHKIDSLIKTISQCKYSLVYEDFSEFSKKKARKSVRMLRKSLRKKKEYCYFSYRILGDELHVYKKNVEKKWWSRIVYIAVDDVYVINLEQ